MTGIARSCRRSPLTFSLGKSPEHVEHKASLRCRRVERLRQAAKVDPALPQRLHSLDQLLQGSRSRSSFHTTSVSPRVCSEPPPSAPADICSMNIFSHPASVSASRCKGKVLVNARNAAVAYQYGFGFFGSW